MNDDTSMAGRVQRVPEQRPKREELLLPMLNATGRTFVPIRRAFIQRPREQGGRAGILSKLTRASPVLDAYLLIHALASSSKPYTAAYPSGTWVQLARLDETATFSAGKSHWSKITSKLVSLNLIQRERMGNKVSYRLLNEGGDGGDYERPRSAHDGEWLRLPYAYWLENLDRELTHPEKIMLLIALDQKEEFRLPFNQAFNWYGVSEDTARRGFRGLVSRGFLSRRESFEASPESPTGWAELFEYKLASPFSAEAIEEAQRTARKDRKTRGTRQG